MYRALVSRDAVANYPHRPGRREDLQDLEGRAHVGLYWGSYLGLGGGVDVGDVGGDAGGARDIVEGELGHEGVLRRMACGGVGQFRRRDRGGSSIGPLRGFRESEDGWERRRTIFMRRPQGWPMPPAAPRTATL